MFKEKKLLILSILIIIVIIAFVIGIEVFYLNKTKVTPNSIVATTQNSNYQMTDKIKINIKNNYNKKICFSSCYPYLLENKSDKESRYFDLSSCPEPNVNRFCLEPSQLKAYEIDLSMIPNLKTGNHIIILPACINCEENESFREDYRFYSNEFLIE